MDYFWEELWNIPADDCMGVSFNGVPPKWMVYGKPRKKVDDLGVSLLEETTICSCKTILDTIDL